MNNLHQIPLVRLVLPLMAGIIIGLYFPPLGPSSWFYPIAIGLIGLMVFLAGQKAQYAAWFGLVVSIFFGLFGIKLVAMHTVANSADFVGQHIVGGKTYVVATVYNQPKQGTKTTKAFAKVQAIATKDGWKKADGNIMIYFAADEAVQGIAYGNKILFRAKVDPVKPPQNAGQFNYKAYLERNGVYYQSYLMPQDYTVIGHGYGSPLLEWVYTMRSQLIKSLRNDGLTGSELAVTSALVLGYDDDVDNELLDAYSASGTMHVLSVSGMHAGIIFLVLGWLLAWMGMTTRAKLARAAIIILVIWFYALLTGFSPPVVRAAAMFSFFAIGNALSRYINTYNLLAGSCLIMLIINPFLLADIGFQLSYLAVLGIAFMFKPLYKLQHIYERITIKTKPDTRPVQWVVLGFNKLSTGIWSIIVMSVVAQLATLPLTLYYFHQFPNYFILANLLVIPLSTIALLGGILVLALSWWPMVASFLAMLLGKVVWVLNALVLWLESLPAAITDNIYFNQAEALVVSFIVLTGIIAFRYGRKYWLYVSLGSFLVFTAFRIDTHYNVLQQKRLVVYNVNKSRAIELVAGEHSILLTDSMAAPGTSNYRFSVKGGGWYFGLQKRQTLTYNPAVLQCNGKTIAIIGKGFAIDAVEDLKHADYVIVTGNPILNYKLVSKLKPKVVIFDSSNKYSRVKYWQREFDRLGIKYYEVSSNGAFSTEL